MSFDLLKHSRRNRRAARSVVCVIFCARCVVAACYYLLAAAVGRKDRQCSKHVCRNSRRFMKTAVTDCAMQRTAAQNFLRPPGQPVERDHLRQSAGRLDRLSGNSPAGPTIGERVGIIRIPEDAERDFLIASIICPTVHCFRLVAAPTTGGFA